MTGLRSLTVRTQHPRRSHQFTYWIDGTGRLDGRSGPMLGAWHARLTVGLERVLAPLIAGLSPTSSRPLSEAQWTLAVERETGPLTVVSADPDQGDVAWHLSMLLEGMSASASWIPLDVRHGQDWSSWIESTTMYLTQRGMMATALARPEGLIVLAGSTASTATSPSLESTYKRRRRELAEAGAVSLHDDRYVLGEHLHFSSPSSAASVLAGSNTNGRTTWRDGRGSAWADLTWVRR